MFQQECCEQPGNGFYRPPSPTDGDDRVPSDPRIDDVIMQRVSRLAPSGRYPSRCVEPGRPTAGNAPLRIVTPPDIGKYEVAAAISAAGRRPLPKARCDYCYVSEDSDVAGLPSILAQLIIDRVPQVRVERNMSFLKGGWKGEAELRE